MQWSTALKPDFLADRFHSLSGGNSRQLAPGGRTRPTMDFGQCAGIDFVFMPRVIIAETFQCEGLAPHITVQFVLQRSGPPVAVELLIFVGQTLNCSS